MQCVVLPLTIEEQSIVHVIQQTRGLPKRVIESLLFVYRGVRPAQCFDLETPLYPIGRTLNNIDQHKIAQSYD